MANLSDYIFTSGNTASYSGLVSTGNIIPAVDNTYFLGNSTNRWANLWLGPGTMYITDSNIASNATAELTVLNGILQVNGATGLQANLIAGNSTLTMNTNGPIVLSPSGAANTAVFNSTGANLTGMTTVANLTVTGNTYSNPTYGSFWDTTTQTNSNVGNAIPISYNSTDGHYGVTIAGAGNTQITIGKTGLYNIQFSAQLSKTDSGSDTIYIWLDKNGTSVTNSATGTLLLGNSDKQVAAWNFVVSATAGDYYRLMWMSLDSNTQIVAEAASGPVPEIPSIILTVVPVGP